MKRTPEFTVVTQESSGGQAKEEKEIFLKLRGFFSANRNKLKRDDRSDRRQTLEEATQFSFLIANFINKNSEDRKFLEKFWANCEKIATYHINPDAFNQMRRSILSQVAAIKIMRALGQEARLSSPREDAFEATDFWVGTSRGQVKVVGPRNKPVVIVADISNFPDIKIEKGDRPDRINGINLFEFKNFLTTLGNIRRDNRDEGGSCLFLVLPDSEFDFITGEPTEEIVTFFKDKLEKIKGTSSESKQKEPVSTVKKVNADIGVKIIAPKQKIPEAKIAVGEISTTDTEKLRVIAHSGKFDMN